MVSKPSALICRTRAWPHAGGEPFLALTLLRSVIEVAARYRIDTYVLTSAHWATGAARAARILAGLPGLTHLAVSADRYHLPFVPLSHVRHALLAAIECGVRPGLTIRLVDPDDPFLPELRAALGEDLMARVGVELGWVTPVGRGRDLPLPPHRQRPPTRELPAGACDLVHHPIVGSDGRVLACCNEGVARRNAPLQLGDLRAEPFTRMTERAEDDLLLHAIRLWGPKRLAEMVQARGLGDRLKGVYPRGDICALCDDLTGQPELVRVLRAELEARREEIVLARLVRFGEWAGTAAETVP
jgi:hypothetical protein